MPSHDTKYQVLTRPEMIKNFLNLTVEKLYNKITRTDPADVWIFFDIMTEKLSVKILNPHTVGMYSWFLFHLSHVLGETLRHNPADERYFQKALWSANHK